MSVRQRTIDARNAPRILRSCMPIKLRGRTGVSVWLTLGVLLLTAACGGDDDSDGDPASGGASATGGASGSAGETSGGSGGRAGSGGTTGSGGNTATGGAAGAAGSGTGGGLTVVPENPHTGMGLVSGGGVAQSENFKLFYTLGDQPSVNGGMRSEQYQIVGGIVGATH